MTPSTDVFDIGRLGFYGGLGAEITTLANGNMVLTWSETGTSIFNPLPGFTDGSSNVIAAWMLDANGNPIGRPFQVNTTEAGLDLDPQVTTLSNGNFVISWTGTDADVVWEQDVRAQIFSPSGAPVGSEIALDATPMGSQRYSRTVATPDGGFIATWTDDGHGGTDVMGQRFSATGQPIGPEAVLYDPAYSANEYEWISIGANQYRVFDHMQTFATTGATEALDGENAFATELVGNNPNELRASTLTSTTLADGSYVMAGTVRPDGAEDVEIYMFARDANDEDLLPEGALGRYVGINETPYNSRNFALEIEGLSSGGLVAVWTHTEEASTSVMARFFDADLVPVGGEVRVDTSAGASLEPVVTETASGEVLIAWTEVNTSAENPGLDFVARRFSVDGEPPSGPPPAETNTFIGTAASEAIIGEDTDDLISGLAGNDTLTGARGDDTVIGGPGADALTGDAGDDLLIGGEVADVSSATGAKIFRVFQATLARFPDSTGYGNWSERLQSGERTLLEVIEGFVGSPEFQATYGALDNTAFVSLLYQNVLGRAPDATGLGNWVGRLEDGMSRAEVVRGFSESGEFKTNTNDAASAYVAAEIDIADRLDDAFRLYQATLDRAPDLTGLENWATRLENGTAYVTVANGFVASPEFQSTYGALDNEAFVTQLYQNVLGRAPDATGLSNWTQRLEDGMSRAAVVQGFAQAPEFVANTEEAFMTFMRSVEGDTFDGGEGDDLQLGSFRADHFIFDATDSGRDRVLQIDPWDTIELTGFGYQSRSEALAQFSEVGRDTVFADGAVSVVFANSTLESFDDVTFLL